MKQKKGIQLNQAFGAVLTLVLVAVLVIIAIVIFVSLSSSFAGSYALGENNETLSMATGSASVANATLCEFADFTVINVNNGTFTIVAANYTITSATGTISNTTSEISGSWYVTWTGTYGGPACTASDEMTDEFGNYTSLIGLVGTIIFLGLVIGILVAAFAFGGRKDV